LSLWPSKGLRWQVKSQQQSGRLVTIRESPPLGELDAPWTKNGERRAWATLTVVVLATAEAAGQ
jgi:hypothetical protein